MQFECIAGACPDTCCEDFNNIFVDRPVYIRYQNLPDGELKKNLLEKHCLLPAGTESHYARIDTGEENKCPFLDATGLCGIQSRLGEEYLSFTCRQYPRLVNLVDGQLEKSASVSCPEVARMVLASEASLKFLEIDSNDKQGDLVISKTLFTTDGQGNPLKPYFFKIRELTLAILQNRDFSIAERLILLGMFFKRLEEGQAGTPTEISDQIALHSKLLNDQSLKEQLAALPLFSQIQISLLEHLNSTGFFQSDLTHEYLDFYQQTLSGLKVREGIPLDEIFGNYQQAYEKYFRAFEVDNHFFLENYLVNKVFSSLFPFGSSPSVFNDFLLLVVLYALIRIQLICLAGHDQGLSSPKAVEFVQSFVKNIEHNEDKLLSIVDLLVREEYVTVAHVSALVR